MRSVITKYLFPFLILFVVFVAIYYDEILPIAKTTETSTHGILEKVNGENLRNTIFHLQEYGNRSMWEKQQESSFWVLERFEQLGIEVDLHEYQLNDRIWPNVIAKIKGEGRDQEIIMLIAHIDSASNNPHIAPGADDNASGVAVLLEIARILKETRVKRTIMFGIFTNEETKETNGVRGSDAYVQKAKGDLMNFKAVINLDILGYSRPKWPFYLGALEGHISLKEKFKVGTKMIRNYLFGIINRKDTVVVAGRMPNSELVTITSQVMGQSSGVKVKRKIGDDCG